MAHVTATRHVREPPQFTQLKKETPVVKIMSLSSPSSGEMSGIESVPDDKEYIKPSDDEMNGIESADDVESVSAQLDEHPKLSPASGRPRQAAMTTAQSRNLHHARSEMSSNSDSDIIMIENDRHRDQARQQGLRENSVSQYSDRDHQDTGVYYTAPDNGFDSQADSQQVPPQSDADMANLEQSSDEGSDDDDLGLHRYVRKPVVPVETNPKPQMARIFEGVQPLSRVQSFDSVGYEDHDPEDDKDGELHRLAKLIDRAFTKDSAAVWMEWP